ncbi:hypothetical protein HDU83_009128 [Entophlyctis luteolus]|nr:hypothetical protein HDU83_009128 [Entophlyctis luteolus]KAJ3394260.1 hypothetical protein HDU84_009015 [Entophlyctis sp. JEL0112]
MSVPAVHTVALKPLESATPTQIAAAIAALRTLGSLPGVKSFFVGETFTTARAHGFLYREAPNLAFYVLTNRFYHCSEIVSVFDSKESLAAYDVDPYHLAVIKEHVIPTFEPRIDVIDFEIRHPYVSEEGLDPNRSGVWHTVAWTAHSTTTPEEIIATRDALVALAAIPGCRRILFGESYSKQSPFTHQLVVELDKKETLPLYSNHPSHVSVVNQYLKPHFDLSGTFAMDFEFDSAILLRP